MRNRPDVRSVTLHQQDGSLTLQAFADREGLTLKQVSYCVRKGLILGARKDARSKKWTVYPPAKLLRRPRTLQLVERPQHVEDAQASSAFDGLHETPESSRGCTAGEPSRNLDCGSSVSATLPDLGVADPLPPADGLPWNCRRAQGLRCPDDGPQSDRSEDAPEASAAACIVLTEEQREELAYAATCQLHKLATGEEADEPEVQEAMRHLYAALRLLEAGRPL